MIQRTLLLAALVSTTLALQAQAQMYGSSDPPPPVPIAPLPPSFITFATGVRVPALPGQSAADGQITFTAPFLEGQARAGLAGITHMKFVRSRDEKKGGLTFRLVNGDRIVGDLVTLDEDVAVIDSAMLGRHEIPRNVIHSIKQRRTSPVLIDSNLTRDGMDVWTPLKGEWFETEKGLRVKANKATSILLCEVPHDGTATLIVNMDASANPKPAQKYLDRFRLAFSFFTSTPQQDWRKDTMEVVVGTRITVVRLRSNGQTFVCSGIGLPTCKGELRIAYDPATFNIQVWIGAERIINKSLDGGPTSGRYVRIQSSSLLDLHSVRMLRGILPPGKGDIAPAEDSDAFLLPNGGRLVATELEVEDGQALIQDPEGNEFKLGLDRIGYLTMRTKDRRALPIRKDDIRVRLQETSVQLKLGKLTDKVLTGSSEILGELSIPRDALATLDCDLLGEKAAAAGKFRDKDSSIIKLTGGAVLPGNIDSIGGGLATITAPWLIGTAKVKLSELAHMQLRHVARAEPGGELLFLTDGSHVAGSLQGISADVFELHTEFMGAFKPPRKFVQSVGANQEPTLIEATDFTAGTMGKWSTIGGRWEHKRSGLLSVCNSDARSATMELPHDGPITVEVVVERSPNRPTISAQCGISATKPAIGLKKSRRVNYLGPYALEMEGVRFDFAPFNIHATTEPHGKTIPLCSYPKGPKPAVDPFLPEKRGIITIAWNPTTGQVTTWSDGRFMLASKIEGELEPGKHVLLGSPRNGVIFKSVRVWKGFAAAGAIDTQAVADKDVAIDKNGKATRGTRITMTDGNVRIPLSDQTSPLTELSSILTARNSRTVVPRKPEHVRVGLARSVILLRLKSMNAKFLAGVSPTLGPVRIPRDAVRWIETKAPTRR